jgi:hypothetical protein
VAIRGTSARVRPALIGLTFLPDTVRERETTVSQAAADLADVINKMNASDVPLLWMLPGAEIFDKSSDSATSLRQIVHQRGDAVGLTGLTGVADQLLRVDELERQLEWAVSNPWSTGAENRHAAIRWLLISEYADGRRHGTRKLYGESKHPLWLLCEHDGRTELILSSGSDRLPVAEVNAADLHGGKEAENVIRRAVRSATSGRARGAPVLLLITAGIDPHQTAECVQAASQILAARGNPSVLTALTDPPGPDSTPDSTPDRTPDRTGEATQLCGSRPLRQPRVETLEAVALLRSRRASRIGMRRILEAAAGEREYWTPPKPQNGDPTGRSIVASMNGEAALEGEGCAVLLDAGRFAGIWPAVSKITETVTARTIAYPSAGSRRKPVKDVPQGCFSFESDQSRGAHSTLALRWDAGEILCTTDFSLLLDFPALLLSQTTVVPPDSGLDLCTHGLPIGSDSPVVTAHFGDGSSYTAGHETPDSYFWGEAFEISVGTMRLCVVALCAEGLVMPWSVHVRRRPQPYLFFGRQTGREHSGRETTSLLVSPGGVGAEAIQSALSGKLPGSVRTELALSRAATAQAIAGLQEA